jgi:hypothetical protein
MAETVEIEFSCSFCSMSHKVSVSLPEGWVPEYSTADIEHALCPKHAPIQRFRDEQCPGCVSGWGDCGLWRDFAYSKMGLSTADIARIRSGFCPRRVNGTMSAQVGRRVLEAVDLSTQAPSVAGNSLADAILEYSARYHGKSA